MMELQNSVLPVYEMYTGGTVQKDYTGMFTEIDSVDGFYSLIERINWKDSSEMMLTCPNNPKTRQALRPFRIVKTPDNLTWMITYIHRSNEAGKSLLTCRGVDALEMSRKRHIFRTLATSNVISAINSLIQARQKYIKFTIQDMPPNLTTNMTQMSWSTIKEGLLQLSTDNAFGFTPMPQERRLDINGIPDFTYLETRISGGIDRTLPQYEKGLFGYSLGNVLSHKIEEDYTEYAHQATVAGEGEGKARVVTGVSIPGFDGNKDQAFALTRFIDARDLQSTYSYVDIMGNVLEKTLSQTEYYQTLHRRGFDKLAEGNKTDFCIPKVTDSDVMKYGRDYFIGDLVKTELAEDGIWKGRVTSADIVLENNYKQVIPKITEMERIE